MWFDLYGIRDMRYIWFNHKASPTVIEIVLQVKEIIDVDLSSETFHMSAVLDIEWVDHRLSWTGYCTEDGCPNNYDEMFQCLDLHRFRHIKKVHVTSEHIWTPTLNLYDGELHDTVSLRGVGGSLPVTVWMNGRVNMKRYVSVVTTCESANWVRDKFPFDYHQCGIKLGSRLLKKHELEVSVNKMNHISLRPKTPTNPVHSSKHIGTEDFNENPEWTLIAYQYRASETVSLLEDKYLDEPYSILQMYFIISRNTPKLLTVVLIPAFCLTILSAFGLVIPIASGEKLGYSVTVLLAFYVYKEAVEDMMAPWENYDETPTLIGLFTAITMSKYLCPISFQKVFNGMGLGQKRQGWDRTGTEKIDFHGMGLGHKLKQKIAILPIPFTGKIQIVKRINRPKYKSSKVYEQE